MENHIVKIISVESVTHDVKRFTIQKPEGFIHTWTGKPKCP
jgi:ferredoxin-NADP reductase